MNSERLRLAALTLLMLGVFAHAQDRDAASPRVGNATRGRELLSILGPKPQTPAGISPLQQQELNRRVRCAAARQEIQDQLDFEAAGSPGFYPLMQLRAMEKEACAPVLLPELPNAPVAAKPAGNFRAPPMAPAAPAATAREPQRRVVAPPTRPVPAASAPSTVQSAAVPSQPPAAAVSTPPMQQPAPAGAPHPVASAAVRPPDAAPRPVPAAPPVLNPMEATDYTPAPNYPDAERQAGHQGTVMVQLVVGADGAVQAASVAKSCGFAALDESAVAAARTWRIHGAAGRTIIAPLVFTSE